jgi:hypothetical protein
VVLPIRYLDKEIPEIIILILQPMYYLVHKIRMELGLQAQYCCLALQVLMDYPVQLDRKVP